MKKMIKKKRFNKIEKQSHNIRILITVIIILFISYFIFSIFNYCSILANVFLGVACSGTIPIIQHWIGIFIDSRFQIKRPFGIIIQEFSKPVIKRRLNAIGISLHMINDDGFNEQILKSANNLLKNKIEMKFLCLNPDSPFVEVRASMEESEPNSLKDKINTTIKRIRDIKTFFDGYESPKIRIDYKTYNKMPTYSLIWIDDNMYYGPYQLTKIGLKTTWIKVNKGSKLYNELESDFNEIWNEKEPDIDKDLSNFKVTVDKLIKQRDRVSKVHY